MIKHNIVTNFLLLYDRHGRHCRKFERERKEDLQFLFRPVPAAGFNSKTIKHIRDRGDYTGSRVYGNTQSNTWKQVVDHLERGSRTTCEKS